MDEGLVQVEHEGLLAGVGESLRIQERVRGPARRERGLEGSLLLRLRLLLREPTLVVRPVLSLLNLCNQ